MVSDYNSYEKSIFLLAHEIYRKFQTQYYPTNDRKSEGIFLYELFLDDMACYADDDLYIELTCLMEREESFLRKQRLLLLHKLSTSINVVSISYEHFEGKKLRQYSIDYEYASRRIYQIDSKTMIGQKRIVSIFGALASDSFQDSLTLFREFINYLLYNIDIDESGLISAIRYEIERSYIAEFVLKKVDANEEIDKLIAENEDYFENRQTFKEIGHSKEDDEFIVGRIEYGEPEKSPIERYMILGSKGVVL